jgi:pfkB family carbohydrate kinase
VPRIGIVGSLVWDLIHGRDPLAPPTEEWGGIAYALGGLDASLPPDWEIVPLIKVGRDLAPQAAELLRGLDRLAPGARCVEVPAPNNRVVLHYQSAERRCERMSGGVPAWTWLELGPMVMDLDALYVNFISGFELTLGTAQALRQGFRGPIYADLHSLFLGMQHDGVRVLQPLADAAAWFGCFDVVQLNEDEMRQLSPDPLSLSAQALGAGTSLLVVTLGPKGAAYVAAPGFDGWTHREEEGVGLSRGGWGRRGALGRAGEQPGHTAPGLRPGASGSAPAAPPAPAQAGSRSELAARTALIAAPRVDALDPTGCGDVFGAAACARLLAGDDVESALRHATALAARNAGLRGAAGLSRHLRGELLVP